MKKTLLGIITFGLIVGSTISQAEEVVKDSSTFALEDDELFPLIPEVSQDGYIHLEWDSLMPVNFGAQNNGNASQVELVQELIGKKISIPGFVVPLDFNDGKVFKFLFVPYMGACVHFPPPPPNQLIYAEMKEGLVLEEQWAPLEIYGTLGAEYVETDIGAAGYTLAVEEIKPFQY